MAFGFVTVVFGFEFEVEGRMRLEVDFGLGFVFASLDTSCVFGLSFACVDARGYCVEAGYLLSTVVIFVLTFVGTGPKVSASRSFVRCGFTIPSERMISSQNT